MHQRFQILRLLADGKFHSGERLANALGISRAAIWKHIKALKDYQLDIHAVTGKGYRLSPGIELLNAEEIMQHTASELHDLQVLMELPSTNQQLLEQLRQRDIHRHVILAEYQSNGRGRRGRNWLSRLGSGLCISLGWRFEGSPESLMGLSLATGVALMRVFHRMGVYQAGLKWPNDVLVDGQKLAGILLEMRGESAGPCHIVLGLGINLQPMPETQARIDQPSIDMESLLGERIRRNQLTGELIREIYEMLAHYQQYGFPAYQEEWASHDCLLGQQATVSLGDKTLSGLVRGVDEQGALLMEINGELERLFSGDVSLRKS